MEATEGSYYDSIPPYPNPPINLSLMQAKLITTRMANEKFLNERFFAHLVAPTANTPERLQPRGYTMRDIGSLYRICGFPKPAGKRYKGWGDPLQPGPVTGPVQIWLL